MPTEALINTSLKVSNGGANICHIILIFLSELVLTCQYLFKLSVDFQKLSLKLYREYSKRICISEGGSRYKLWNNRRGWNRSTLSYMHPLKKSPIDINRGCKSFFTRDVKFEEFKMMGDKIPKGRFLFGINRCSQSMKSIMSLRILTLILFRRQ